MTSARICHVGGEGMFMPKATEALELPHLPIGIGVGFLMLYFFLGVAMISDIFMTSIETVTSRRRKIIDKETGRGSTEQVWNSTVATLTLMALGSSAPEIFLAVIEIFKKEFHTGELGPSTIIGSASFNLFAIIAVCISVIPNKEVRIIENMNAFVVTALFSVGAYMWMVFVLIIHGKDVVDVWEAVITFLFLPLLVWVAYSADVGFLGRKINEWHGKDTDPPRRAQKRGHRIGFENEDLLVPGLVERQDVTVKIERKGAARGECRCTYRTECLTAVAGYDFTDVAGIVEFEKQETEVLLQLEVLPRRRRAVSRQFLLILEDAEANVDFDPDGDGGVDCATLTVTIQAIDEKAAACSLDRLINFNAIRFGFDEWLDQFTSIPWVNGSREEQEEASHQDWAFHICALFWKFLFAFVPPTSFFGGWVSFSVSLCMIGLLTAAISDIAEMFGCVLEIPDIVTATIFVALGTSMPDLFASLSAAVGDPTADASIVNVTGSNSVNVFLGLGVPWTVAACFWTFSGRTADWEGRYPEVADNPKYAGVAVFVVESRNLGFCVMVFSALSTVAIMLLTMRRKYLGAELGGPSVPKHAASFLLMFLWMAFVALTSWRVIRCEGAAKGHWCKASVMEQSIVGGSVMLLTAIVSVPCLASTYWYSKEAKAEAQAQLKTKRWSEVFSSESVNFAEEIAQDIHQPAVLMSSTSLMTSPSLGDLGSASLYSRSISEKDFSSGSDQSSQRQVSNAASSHSSDASSGDRLAKTRLADEAPAFDDCFEDKQKTLHSQVQFLRLGQGVATPRVPGKSNAAGAYVVSTLPSAHARNNTVVTVIVVAHHSRGRNETVFQTKRNTALRKVMQAWCREHSMDDDKAEFFGKSVREALDGTDTPASLGHNALRGPLILRVRPVRANRASNGGSIVRPDGQPSNPSTPPWTSEEATTDSLKLQGPVQQRQADIETVHTPRTPIMEAHTPRDMQV